MTDTKKKRPRRRFSEEFKREAVALYQSSGVSATQLCVDLGVSQSLLYRWAREFRDPQPRADQPSYEELEKEVRRLRRELDFLTKASRYFASQQSFGIGS